MNSRSLCCKVMSVSGFPSFLSASIGFPDSYLSFANMYHFVRCFLCIFYECSFLPGLFLFLRHVSLARHSASPVLFCSLPCIKLQNSWLRHPAHGRCRGDLSRRVYDVEFCASGGRRWMRCNFYFFASSSSFSG